MATLFINLIVILLIIAVFYLVLYIFQKLVMPIDNKIIGILVFIAFALLCVYTLTNHSLVFWK